MSNPERCTRCDQPKGSTERADELSAVRAWSEWARGKGPRLKWSEVVDAVRADQPGLCTDFTCFEVDWRQRALAAEAEVSRMRPVVKAAEWVTVPEPSPSARARKMVDLIAAVDAFRLATGASKEQG